MMPGETHSAAPGTAADLSRCQGCASLQQNLNEYVDALITLKQKIINTDNLLTEYQKKCDELQFARRENSTLHHQVEQMLQKISPLQKCQEELGSLKAELEEKKSSLKLYQETHQEYARVKEECLRSDAQKKKLEAKVKKLEEAAVKKTQDFKQLRNEKKILEKKFKETQERLDEFSKQKNEKELRHIGTQISSDSYGSIDRRKVKLLLKELWLCINTTHRLAGEGSRLVPEKPAKEDSRCRIFGEDGLLPPAPDSSPVSSDVQTCLTELSLEMEGDFASCKSLEKEMLSGAHLSMDDSEQEWPSRVSVQGAGDSDDSADRRHLVDDDLQAAIDFFKLPPPLLSPVPSPPPPMASPLLCSLPSSLAPETFGEHSDSSDSDSTQLQSSAEYISEDDTTESEDYFGRFVRSEGNGTWKENPQSYESIQALSKSAVNKVTTVGHETVTAALRGPSATSFSQEERWTVSSEVGTGRRGLADEAGGRVEAREAEQTLGRHGGGLWVEKLSRRLAQEDGASASPEQCSSPLGERSLTQLLDSEGKALSSRMTVAPTAGFPRWTLTDEIAPKSDCVTVSGHFQRVYREVSKEREGAQGSASGESPVPGGRATGDVRGVAELFAKANFSSTSVPVSVCSNAQSPQLAYGNDTDIPTNVTPTELHHSEHTLQTKTLNTLLLHSEPPKSSFRENSQGNNLHALNPVLGASHFNEQRSREIEPTKTAKDTTKMYSLSQSIFRRATRDGQCESQHPGMDLGPRKSDLTLLVDSQAGLIKSDSGFVKSTSWHHRVFLKRGNEESLRATSEHAQKTNHPLEKAAALALQRRGSAAVPEPPRESSAVSLLPNQVSVITKQARPEKTQSALSGHERLPAGDQASSSESCDGPDDTAPVAKCREGGVARADIREAAAVKGSSPEPSASWRKPGCDSQSRSLRAVSLDCSTDKVYLEDLTESQAAMRKAAGQGEAPGPRQPPHSPEPDIRGVASGERLPVEAAVSGGRPVAGTTCAGTEALAVASAPAATPRDAPEHARVASRAACGPCPGSPGSTGAASARGTEAASPGMPRALFCYRGSREAGEDTEVEGSEAHSCSEGEPEPEARARAGQQGVARHPGKDRGGERAPGAAQGRPNPSVEVAYLTSALQDFNISGFSDMDRLSTSEVVTFLESCQLKDVSSGDSVSECSSRGTLCKETNKEIKQRGPSGGKRREQRCEGGALEASEEWTESEDDDGSVNSTGQPARCSLQTLSEVLTKMGRELQSACENRGGKDPADLLLLEVHGGLAAEDVRAKALPPPPPTPRPHPQDSPSRPEGEGEPGAAACADGGGEGLAEPAGPTAQPRVDPCSPEAQEAFQCQISTEASEIISVLIDKGQNLVIEKGDDWTIISGVSLSPDVDQVILCDASGGVLASQDQIGLKACFASVTSVEKSPETSQADPPIQEPLCGSDLAGVQEDVAGSGQNTNFDKSRLRNRPVKPSIWISSQIYDQTFETQNAVSDHTYYNSKLDPSGKNKSRSKISNKDQLNKPGKSVASGRSETQQKEAAQSLSGEKGNTKSHRSQTQPVLANADTSTPTDSSTDTLSKIRQEVGPPLPPLLAPLIATPPRTSQPLSPLIANSSPSSPASPASRVSPSCETPRPPVLSPWLGDPQRTSPSPSPAAASGRIVSSPLQFCAATPKHALPVPGRLPPCAPGHAAVGAPQENSVKILDTMYPELSARARTLSILKGNLQLSRGSSADGKGLPGPVSARVGFKELTSKSTAFVKAGGGSGAESSQDRSGDLGASGKRTLSAATLRSAKRLRLDSQSPEPGAREAAAEGAPPTCLPGSPPRAGAATTTTEEERTVPSGGAVPQDPVNPKETVASHDKAIAQALKKIAESSFDLLPVIRSHVYVGNISKKPVMRDQEKEVVYEFCTAKKHLAECLLHSILSELKLQKISGDHNYIHALCRVYVGICRQLGNLERARLFCYGLLKEDFPESEKLTLFIANMWHDVFLSQSVINKAMQLVARQRAKGEVLNCLRAFLNWEKSAPVDVGIMISKLLLTIQLCPKTEFQSSEKFGEDLSGTTWEYIFAIDLLCCHQKWIWTHDNIISKELWPVMDKWIKYRKGHANIAYTPDVIIASILRLIGRLGQLGLKEGFPTAVKNISSVIGMFIQHAQDEDIPWGIQLAAVYALCDLSPSNPAEISKILEAWRRETSNSIPSAVIHCLEEVSSLSAEALS